MWHSICQTYCLLCVQLAIGHGYQYVETSAHEGMNAHRVSARFNALSLIDVLVSLIPSSQVCLRLAEMLLQDHDIFMPGAEVWFVGIKYAHLQLVLSVITDPSIVGREHITSAYHGYKQRNPNKTDLCYL